MTDVSADRRARLQTIPKIELHCHLESAMTEQFIRALAVRNGLTDLLPGALRAYEATDFTDYLDGYDAGARLLRHPRDFAEAIDGYLHRAAEQGVVCAEIFFSPMIHLDDGVSYRDQVQGLTDGIRHSGAGVGCRLIPSIDRSRPLAQAEAVVADILDHRDDLIVGVGLDYDERLGEAAQFATLFSRIRREGLHVTSHAGETADASAVLASIDLLGCERIDHGYTVLGDEAALSRCRDQGTVFTVSSGAVRMLKFWGVDLAGRPIDMWRNGLCISPATDAPTHFGTSITDEMQALLDGGVTETDLYTIEHATIAATFLDDTDRTALSRRFRDQGRGG